MFKVFETISASSIIIILYLTALWTSNKWTPHKQYFGAINNILRLLKTLTIEFFVFGNRCRSAKYNSWYTNSTPSPHTDNRRKSKEIKLATIRTAVILNIQSELIEYYNNISSCTVSSVSRVGRGRTFGKIPGFIYHIPTIPRTGKDEYYNNIIYLAGCQ